MITGPTIAGTAFSISPGGTLKVVHRFGPPGAVRPVGGLTLATDGQYYGTNEAGGTSAMAMSSK